MMRGIVKPEHEREAFLLLIGTLLCLILGLVQRAFKDQQQDERIKRIEQELKQSTRMWQRGTVDQSFVQGSNEPWEGFWRDGGLDPRSSVSCPGSPSQSEHCDLKSQNARLTKGAA
jgi:hypothetical protein